MTSADETTKRHKALYDAVHDGDPGEVQTVAVVWESLSRLTGQIHSELHRDLESLRFEWSGMDSDMHRAEMVRIEGLCKLISDGAADIRQTLLLMSQKLEEVQREIPHPAGSDARPEVHAAVLTADSWGFEPDEENRTTAYRQAQALVRELDDWYEDRGELMRSPWEATTRHPKLPQPTNPARDANATPPDPVRSWLMEPDP